MCQLASVFPKFLEPGIKMSFSAYFEADFENIFNTKVVDLEISFPVI